MVKSILTTSHGVAASVVTTYYVNGIYEKEIVDGGSATIRKYYAGVAMRENDTLYFTLRDHLGSTSVIADASGGIVSEIRYDPFGGTRYTSNPAPTDYRYTGQREHAEIGLYFYNARWYDSSLGHFVQADSVVPGTGSPMAYDRYSYVQNNPISHTDPTGHYSCYGASNCMSWLNDALTVMENSGPTGRGAAIFFKIYDQLVQNLCGCDGVDFYFPPSNKLMPDYSLFTIASIDLLDPLLGEIPVPAITIGAGYTSSSPDGQAVAGLAHEFAHLFQGFAFSLSTQGEAAGYVVQYLVLMELGIAPDNDLERLYNLWEANGFDFTTFGSDELNEARDMLHDYTGGHPIYDNEVLTPVLEGFYRAIYGNGGSDFALMRIPVKPITDSGAWRSRKPMDADRVFRAKAIMGA